MVGVREHVYRLNGLHFIFRIEQLLSLIHICKTIPNRIRIIVQLVVVAALVTIVSEILKARCV